MANTLTLNTTFIQEDCCRCHANYCLTQDFVDRAHKQGGSWYCPYCGTKQHYSKTENQKLKDEIKRRERLLASERARLDQVNADLKFTKNSLRAQKAAKTRIKNRVSKGICPCCNRYFINLHKHMENKHPDYVLKE